MVVSHEIRRGVIVDTQQAALGVVAVSGTVPDEQRIFEHNLLDVLNINVLLIESLAEGVESYRIKTDIKRNLNRMKLLITAMGEV